MYKMGKTLIMTQSEGKIYCLFFISIMPRVKLRKFYIFGNLNYCICLLKFRQNCNSDLIKVSLL